MTDEVGVITGDLTVRTTRTREGLAAVVVEYTGAEESYTLTGSPVPVHLGRLGDYHQAVLTAIEAGGEATAPRL